MSALPEGWTEKPLGEVATLQRGFDLPVQNREAGQFPIFAANGQVGVHNLPKVKGPGVVTGRSGTLGKVHFVEGDFWPLNTALWVKDFHGNDERWVARLLQWLRLERHTRGTGVPTLNRNLVHLVPVLRPPLSEQHRIATILDKADAIRRKRQEALALTDEFLRSAFLDMFGDPVTNLKGWEEKPLDKLLVFLTSGSRGWAKYYSDEGKLFLRIQNVGKTKLILDDIAFVTPPEGAETKRTLVRTGDVLLSITADLGRTCVIPQDLGPTYINQHLAILRVQGINPHYLSSFLASAGGQRQIQGLNKEGVKAGLNFNDIRSLKIPVPPHSLQHKYRDILEKHSQMALSVQKAETGDSDLFQSLTQRAFRGEL